MRLHRGRLFILFVCKLIERFRKIQKFSIKILTESFNSLHCFHPPAMASPTCGCCCTCGGCVLTEARHAFRLAKGVLKRYYASWTEIYKPRAYASAGNIYFGVRTCSTMNTKVLQMYDTRRSAQSNAVAWVRHIRRLGDAPGMLPAGCTAEDWTTEAHAFLCTNDVCANVRGVLLCLQRLGILCIAPQVVHHMVRDAEIRARWRRNQLGDECNNDIWSFFPPSDADSQDEDASI
jgi:hypothetical protein